ncbi:tripartite tricarboxylate transporter TctB family protein [Hwanghaeella grinnelliae]|uniref:Tripartite tricarboxylate transporter TctB family protein n=1 Tax=Hwanghaeella grinnelliae TaxID=2500179 RepID=A0A437QQ71_9PROT|nr:tripartite tricarboxylate transporter TctB family protein [Hwanghaeella grinnelliae]RVU36668.1 tripartite tricarboxylate transporter TctB family protein [Hwanghaeella grinnelliae]
MTASTSTPLRPGERLFALLLVLFAALVFWQSYEISGFKGLTTGGVMPMFASGVMVATSIFLLSRTLAKPQNGDGSLAGLAAFLFPLRVVLFALAVLGYVISIPVIGFLPASAVFLFVAIWRLWKTGVLRAGFVTVVAVGAIHVLFRIVFQVVLPSGSVWL